jgi:threonine dehydrogenase-like Zn-dependent dehydrogenase
MLAVHLENGVVSVREVPAPVPAAGFALLRMIAAGICNTDLELQRGYYGFVGTPGHEFVGEVVRAAGPGLVGRRVTGEINLACTDCEWCRKGLGRHCPNRSVLGIVRHPGAFAGFLTLPERNLHLLPEDLPVERAVFVEPLAAACEILDQVAIPCGETIAVLGDGKLGLLVAMVLRVHGYAVHLFGRHTGKLAIAARAGVQTALSAEAVPACEYNWVVDATGSADGLRQAVSMTRPRGTVILKSTLHGAVAIDTAAVIVNEVTLVGSRCGRFEAALPLLEHGLIPVEDMLTARYPLREAPRAFAHAAERGAVKVLLE